MSELGDRLNELEKAGERARQAADELAARRLQVVEALKAAYEAGATVAELARRLGVSRQRVYTMLRD